MFGRSHESVRQILAKYSPSEVTLPSESKPHPIITPHEGEVIDIVYSGGPLIREIGPEVCASSAIMAQPSNGHFSRLNYPCQTPCKSFWLLQRKSSLQKGSKPETT